MSLPLPQEVGDAILRYLQCRPRVETDRVFVTTIAPFQPFQRGDSVSSVVGRAMKRAGVEKRHEKEPIPSGTRLRRRCYAKVARFTKLALS